MANTEIRSRFFGSAAEAARDNKDVTFSDRFLEFGSLENLDPARDRFWDFASAKDLQLRWDKLYPFQLLILQKKEGNYKVFDTFTLPIPPQDLTVTTPFAITTSVTLGGILEEHNGAPLRTIVLSGTTGVLPLRGSVERSSLLGLLQETGVFGGTVQALNQVQTAVQQFGNVLGASDLSTPPNVHPSSEFEGEGIGRSTGYYQFLLLQRFLESYAFLKKTTSALDLRLALAIWKEQAVYLVTPVVFEVRRSAGSPLEYTYNLQFKAWRRITLEGSKTVPFLGHVGVTDPSKFAQIINLLEQSRRVLHAAHAVLKAVRADIKNALFTPLRQAALFAKDATGLAQAISDFSGDLAVDLQEPILEAVREGDDRGTTADRRRSARWLNDALLQQAIESQKRRTRGGRRPDFGALFGALRDGSPANKAFLDPDDHYDFFSSFKVGDLNLRPDTVRKLEDERRRVRLLRRRDFEVARDSVLTVLADFSDFVGAGNETYTRTYGLPVRTSTKTPTDDDWEVIHALSQAAQALDAMAVSSRIDRDFVNSLDFVAGLATRSGIAFRVPRSKYAVPFPYGYTLEQLSLRYLGTPDRWHEIAALNGLQAPYVDEEGFELPLLTNGSGNQVTVSDGSRFFSGQRVWLGSTTVRRERRRVQKVEVVAPGHAVLTLDGAGDLHRLTTVAKAVVQAFTPNTVNSQMQVYIPSDADPPDEDFRVKAIPGVDYFDPLVQSGGVDLLLTADGDLVITPDGDTRLAVGLVNLIQKVRLAVGTPKGSLLHHPDYGLGVKAGTSTADVSAQDLLTQARQLFRDDPGFSGVEAAAVRKDGGHLKVSLGIGIAGTSQVIPVHVDVRR